MSSSIRLSRHSPFHWLLNTHQQCLIENSTIILSKWKWPSPISERVGIATKLWYILPKSGGKFRCSCQVTALWTYLRISSPRQFCENWGCKSFAFRFRLSLVLILNATKVVRFVSSEPAWEHLHSIKTQSRSQEHPELEQCSAKFAANRKVENC